MIDNPERLRSLLDSGLSASSVDEFRRLLDA
jgi:hypothetical protein